MGALATQRRPGRRNSSGHRTAGRDGDARQGRVAERGHRLRNVCGPRWVATEGGVGGLLPNPLRRKESGHNVATRIGVRARFVVRPVPGPHPRGDAGGFEFNVLFGHRTRLRMRPVPNRVDDDVALRVFGPWHRDFELLAVPRRIRHARALRLRSAAGLPGRAEGAGRIAMGLGRCRHHGRRRTGRRTRRDPGSLRIPTHPAKAGDCLRRHRERHRRRHLGKVHRRRGRSRGDRHRTRRSHGRRSGAGLAGESLGRDRRLPGA
ncbi:MAG: hypothetical protein QOH27_3895 [Mycobacterium sp.]|nr:hypothetical protein [Mycobacterium sp.]